MFPLFGIAEVVTLFVDAAIVALVSARWGFAWLRMFGAWLGVSAATIALLVILVTGVVQVYGFWGSRAPAVAAIGSLPVWLVARALTLRRMSRSPALLRDTGRAFGWGWVITVSVGSLIVALALGGLVQALAGDR